MSLPAGAAVDDVPGWYGKLPMLGDFASRRLPAPFVAACDAWLSKGIETSRQQLGEQWLQHYLTAPLWHFAWAPGVVDALWCFGVLMPSVDCVGRYFPLLVALRRPGAPGDAASLAALDAAYGRMGEAALANLRPHASLEGFERDLAQARCAPWPPAAALPAAQALPGRRRHVAPAARPLDQWVSALQADALARRLEDHSVWWPAADSAGIAGLTICRGLPPPPQLAQLLQGHW